MPDYTYKCDCGKTQTWFCKMGSHPHSIRCACGKWAGRYWLADLPRVQTDPEFCSDDIKQELGERKTTGVTTRPVLARTIRKVPGIPKYRDPETGKVYAAFRNKQHRRRVLKSIGLGDAE